MMKRKYMRPAVRAVTLQQQQHLLSISGEISGYSRSSGGFSQGGSSQGGSSQGVKHQGNPVNWDE